MQIICNYKGQEKKGSRLLCRP